MELPFLDLRKMWSGEILIPWYIMARSIINVRLGSSFPASRSIFFHDSLILGIFRVAPVCERVRNVARDDEEIVVTSEGDGTTVEIFSLCSLTWRLGTSVRGIKKYAASIVEENAMSFYLLGGYGDTTEKLTSILKYDANEETWTEMPQKLLRARHHFNCVKMK